jgi:putative chitinase
MNEAAFFAAVRTGFGVRLTQVQVRVAQAIMARAANLSVEHLAYIFATAWGEAKMTPKRENMNYSAKRIRQVWPSRPEAVAFAGKPEALANSVYGGRLGNRRGTDDGWRYRGGGVDQLTGRDHYTLVGIADAPEKILEPDFAAWSIVHGMTTGRYTGRKLSDYGDGSKFNARSARAIVNGDVKLNGTTYASHWRVFRDALRAAGWTPGAAVPLPKPAAKPKPRKAAPARESATTTDKGGGAASAVTTVGGGVVGGALILGLWNDITATFWRFVDFITFWN